jgi:hypothetical protein
MPDPYLLRSATGKFLTEFPLEALRAFYQAWGHRAVLAGGAVWFDGGAFSMMSIPTVLVPDLEEKAVRRILSQTAKWAAVYRVENPGEKTVPLFTLRDKTYDFGHLQRQFRQQVRVASSMIEARECSWEEWRAGGLPCDRDTLRRHGKYTETSHPLLTAEGRERIAAAAAEVPGLRIHACFGANGIAAYLIHLRLGDTCEGLLAHRCDAHADSPARFASHLLYFSFAKAAMATLEISAVCVGRQSVPANESLARFKRHAGFVAEPCHLRIRLHPVLAPFLENRVASAFLRRSRVGFSRKIPKLMNLEVLESAALRG